MNFTNFRRHEKNLLRKRENSVILGTLNIGPPISSGLKFNQKLNQCKII